MFLLDRRRAAKFIYDEKSLTVLLLSQLDVKNTKLTTF